MPNLRQKVADFIRQLSATSETRPSGQKEPSTSNKCFIQRYLSGQDDGREEPKIIHGHTPQQLPPKTIGAVSRVIIASMTGPNGGLTTVNKKQRHLSISDPDVHFIDTAEDDPSPGGGRDANCNTSGVVNCNLIPPPAEYTGLQKSESTPNAASGEPIAGVCGWTDGNSRAYGCSTTLYERHPVTGVPAGEPIADCYAIVARQNSAVLVLADGVNWGQKACLAARAAVHGCVDHLNQALYSWTINTTTDAFIALLRSFHAAHNLILEEEGMLTTLTAVLVLPLVAPNRYIACACNVGDSLAYVYSPKYGVREITQGSHDVHRMRDMRDALGALGPVDGTNPELGNLTCAMTEVDPGDIVFLTSDGVSDNLDPVVGKFTGLVGVEAHQRHKLGLLRTEDLLEHGVSGSGPRCSSAKELVELLVDFVTRLTAAKRRLLEDADLYSEGGLGPLHRSTRKQLCTKLAAVPGKLDHASVVAYTVGEVTSEDLT